MTKREKELLDKGYRFSGNYSRDKEHMKSVAAEYREKGFYATVVNDGSVRVMSRGRGMKWSGGGYSVYIKEKGNK